VDTTPGGQDAGSYVDLYWLPLGAGEANRCVRVSGRLFEAVAARREHRPARDLYHTALQVRHGPDRYVIEMAPVWLTRQPDRGVVAEGPVDLPWLGRWRLFRYEVRRWRNGIIPDIAEAVASPQQLHTDPERARLLLDLAPAFPGRRLVPRRTAHRRHVELQHPHRLATRSQRPLRRRDHPASTQPRRRVVVWRGGRERGGDGCGRNGRCCGRCWSPRCWGPPWRT
jgi:hypothetical protein